MCKDFSLAKFSARFQHVQNSLLAAKEKNNYFHSDMQISYQLMGATYKGDIVDYNAPYWKKSAVLIIISDHQDGAKVLFTARSSTLRHHAGQVSFPGGRLDASDNGAVAAALREANEEIALQTDNIDVLGELPPYFTGTGYKITPVVAAMCNDQEFIANPAEVETIFQVPLAFLMDPKNHEKMYKEIDGIQRSWYALHYQDYVIWGATAGMIVYLYERLYA